MADIEKVIKGLEWILEDDRFGFGVNWENGEPRDDYEKAGKIITDGIALLKEQEAEISFLKGMQLKTIHNMSEGDIGDAVAKVLRLKGW